MHSNTSWKIYFSAQIFKFSPIQDSIEIILQEKCVFIVTSQGRCAHVHREVKYDHHQMKKKLRNHTPCPAGIWSPSHPNWPKIQSMKVDVPIYFLALRRPARSIVINCTLGQDSPSCWEVVEVICTFTHACVLTVSVPTTTTTTTFCRDSRYNCWLTATKWKMSKNKNENSLSLITSQQTFRGPSHSKNHSIETGGTSSNTPQRRSRSELPRWSHWTNFLQFNIASRFSHIFSEWCVRLFKLLWVLAAQPYVEPKTRKIRRTHTTTDEWLRFLAMFITKIPLGVCFGEYAPSIKIVFPYEFLKTPARVEQVHQLVRTYVCARDRWRMFHLNEAFRFDLKCS